MAGSFSPRRGARGGYYNGRPMELWENRSGRPPGTTRIKPDPATGYYKLHVRSIPYLWNKVTMFNVFSKVGEPKNIYLHPSRDVNVTWGFVEFASFEEATRAIQELNHNVMLDHIEVSFAREKAEPTDLSNFYEDPVPDFLMEQTGRRNSSSFENKSAETHPYIDPRTLTKTVQNDKIYSTEYYTKNFDYTCDKFEDYEYLEEYLVQTILENHKNSPPTGECSVCQAASAFCCSICATHYCSDGCQTKDWPTHSKSCKVPYTSREDNCNKKTDELSNVVKSNELGRDNQYEKENRYKNTFNEKKPDEKRRSDDRPNNNGINKRNFDDYQCKIDDRRKFNKDEKDEKSTTQRNMFEERRSKYISQQQNPSTNADSKKNHQTNQNEVKKEAEKAVSTAAQGPNFKTSSYTRSLGTDFISKEQAFLKEPNINEELLKLVQVEEKSKIDENSLKLRQVVQEPNVDEDLLKIGQVEKVMIMVVESMGLFHVQLERKMSEFGEISNSLSIDPEKEPDYPTFTPLVKGSICAAMYDHTLCRCRIVNLNPLEVAFIDFGNIETIATADKLFAIPEKLSTIQPLAVKIKLADPSPSDLVTRQDGDNLYIKPIEKADDCWIVELADALYSSVQVSSPPKAQVDKEIIQPKPPPAKPSFPRILPADVFTEVTVKQRDENYITVMPLKNVEEYENLMKDLQTQAVNCSPILPQVNAKCIAKDSKNNQWYRGRIIQLDPLNVSFVDTGTTELCTSESIKDIPPTFVKIPPLVLKVKAKSGKEFLKNNIFSIKPLYKDPEDNTWVVEGAPASVDVKKDTSVIDIASPTSKIVKSDMQPQSMKSTPLTMNSSLISKQEDTKFPDLFAVEKFTVVTITYSDPENEDVYYVGSCDIWQRLLDMSTVLEQTVNRSENAILQLGALGVALYEDGLWYRVKVVSTLPPLVQYIDCGNIDPIKPENLKKCPDSHKYIPQLAHKIKLGPGTDNKYLHLPEQSTISIKAQSMLPDGTVMVEVESTPCNVQLSVSNQMTENVFSEQLSISSQPQNLITSASKHIEATTLSTTTDTSDNITLRQCKPQNITEQLQNGWKVCLSPNKMDSSKNALIGLLYTECIHETKSYATESQFENILNSETCDSINKPNEGDLVACKVNDDWTRGILLSEGIVALVDLGGVAHHSGLKKLPLQFINIPFLATVLKLNGQQPLDKLLDEIEIILTATKVNSVDGHTRIEVSGNFEEFNITGELEGWIYEPLKTPNPLSSGDLVTICKVIDSNTVLVTPVANQNIEQKIQLECRKSDEQFQSPPSVGDYVAYFMSDSDVYCRSRIKKIDENNFFVLYNIDVGTENITNKESLQPLPASLSKIPCQTTKVVLKGVQKVDLTKAYEFYINDVVANEKVLKIEFDQQLGLATLTTKDTEEVVNKRLEELLKPILFPDSNGKYFYGNMPEPRLPMNEEVIMMVSHTAPLYLQMQSHLNEYYALHKAINAYCESENVPYNPCTNELCLAKFEGEWYRSMCVKETNSGISSQFLIDFGNMFDVTTNNIRQIKQEMVAMPWIGIPCTLKGLPDNISPSMQSLLDDTLKVYAEITVIIESIDHLQQRYEITIPSLIKSFES